MKPLSRGLRPISGPLVSYFTAQMEELKIKVVKQEATLNTIHTGGFEAVIIASGASPLIPRRSWHQ